MAEPSKQNKGVREPGTRVFKVASSLGEPELDPTGASFRHSIESLLNLPRAVENADNFNALRQYFVEDEKLLEPRNQDEPASLDLEVFVADERPTLGELREAFKPGITFL